MIEKTDGSFAALTEIPDTLGGGSRCVSRGPGRGAAHLETVKTVCAGLVVCGCVCVYGCGYTFVCDECGASSRCRHLVASFVPPSLNIATPTTHGHNMHQSCQWEFVKFHSAFSLLKAPTTITFTIKNRNKAPVSYRNYCPNGI